MSIAENQWYQSPVTKRLFFLKAIFYKSAQMETKRDHVVLVEAAKENEIIYKYEDFEELIKNKQLEKIS